LLPRVLARFCAARAGRDGGLTPCASLSGPLMRSHL
jgi:hypothetical protein